MKNFFLVRWITTLAQMYIDAFKHGLSRQLFIVIAIKMFIMFAILKAFFFHDYLDERFDTDEEKSSYVLDNLTNPVYLESQTDK